MRYIYIFFTLLISSCGSGGTSQISNELSIIDIIVNGLVSPSISYQKQSIEIISSNNSCDFEISLEDSEIYKIHHIDTLDYKKITKSLIAFIESSEYKFIEALGEGIVDHLKSKFGIKKVKLRLSKPGALRFSKDVGIMIER